jgi:hypothetical protein
MRAAMIINQADKQTLTTPLPPTLAEVLEELRDVTFWQKKNFMRITELTRELDQYMKAINQAV